MHFRLFLSVLFLAPLYACADDTLGTSDLDTLEKKASYAFGVNIATRIKSGNIIFDPKALSQGVEDSLSGNKFLLSDKVMKQAHTEFISQEKAKLQEEQLIRANLTLEVGKQFLRNNAKEEGVTTLDSGLQYKVITEGTGDMPTETDTVITHYRGTLIDGSEFDSSYKRNKPATFPVKGVIKGWTEALQLMKVGAKWKLFIPSGLAYGKSKRSELILPNTTLIFELELIGIKPTKS